LQWRNTIWGLLDRVPCSKKRSWHESANFHRLDGGLGTRPGRELHHLCLHRTPSHGLSSSWLHRLTATSVAYDDAAALCSSLYCRSRAWPLKCHTPLLRRGTSTRAPPLSLAAWALPGGGVRRRRENQDLRVDAGKTDREKKKKVQEWAVEHEEVPKEERCRSGGASRWIRRRRKGCSPPLLVAPAIYVQIASIVLGSHAGGEKH
jgi:hypothetical protein